MRRILTATIQQPRLTLVVIGLVTVVLLAGLFDWGQWRWGLKLDATVQPLLPKDDPALAVYEYSRELFGSEDAVIVALSAGPVLEPDTLALLGELHRGLAAMPGVERVSSLYSATLAREFDGGTEVWPVAVWLERFGLEPAALLRELSQHPTFRRTLISDDGQVAGLVVTLRDDPDSGALDGGFAHRLVTTADRLVEEHAQRPAQVWVGGPRVVAAETVAAISRSYNRLIPAIAVVFIALLAFAFRSVRAVVLPLLTMAVALAWMLGAMGWLGRQLNLVTVIVPPLIMTLGLAYSIHFFAPYYALAERFGRRPRLLVGLTLKRIAFPMVLTGITTICGFLGLMVSPLPAVREFGGFAAFGVAVTVLVAMTMVPAVLTLAGPPRHQRRTDVLDPLFGVLSRLLLRYRHAILLTGAAVGVLGLAAATQIRVGSNFVADFAADARVRRDHEAIGRALGGANVFNILIRADLNDAFAQPDILAAIDDLQHWLEAQPEIGASVSLIDGLRQIDRVLGGDPAHFEIPDRVSTIKQMLVLGGGPELNAVVDSRLRVSNLIVRATPDDSFALAALVARIEHRLEDLPPPLRADVTGNMVVVAHTLGRIGEGQVLTLGVAILAVLAVLTVVFMSLRGALIALLPNVLPIAVYYGALGLSGVPLSPTTSLISCIVLGVAVDDTIHYLARFNAEARRLGDETAATATALRDVLRPVTLTSIALVLGFLMLTGSELRNQVHFGALAALTMGLAWLSDVSFTPALAARMRVVTLWELLRFDLGANPDEAIPLFHGLNLYQARTFALLAQEKIYKAGDVLWRQGDDSDDIYVVIHGELQVWLESDGNRRLLTTLRRGDVIGEGGFFRQRRSATVIADTPARLLQFTAEDLDQITRRRPLLGAKILRNLNRIQAERVARLSHQIRG